MQAFTHDIVIIGGGMVGASLACLLAEQTDLHVALLESQSDPIIWDESSYHHRVSAIALSSRRIFQTLDIWDAIRNKRISPFKKIHVWDAASKGEINFDCEEIAETVLGYIIENNLIQSELQKKLCHYPQVEFISPVVPVALRVQEKRVQLVTAENQEFNAKLVIAADGARSWVREQSGIEFYSHDYEQTAIVATIETELSPHKVASQVFLESGPLAFLPLAYPCFSSIVWSLPTDQAKQMLDLDDEKFKTELARAFSFRLGEVRFVDKRHSFPLFKQQVKNYVQPRIALVGDASHTVHPLAGQGVNMGLLDAACLADVIVDAFNKRRDFSSFAVLRYYERWRKADNFALLASIDIIKTLFASNKKSIQALRAFGLNLTNRIPFIKNVFTYHAVGSRNDLPKAALSKL